MSEAVDTARVENLDGRRARAERNRDAVVEAILELLREGVDQPSANEIAERSGVSVRSVFRHFEDLETLYAAAIDAQLRVVGPLFALDLPEASTAERIDALVEQRAELFEVITPVRRAAEGTRRRAKVIDAQLRESRKLLRKHVERGFGPELASRSGTEREDLLDALELATSWRAWDTLRSEQRLSPARAKRVLSTTLHRLLLDR